MTDEFVDAAELNTHLRDNVAYLHSPVCQLQANAAQNIGTWSTVGWQGVAMATTQINDDTATYTPIPNRITVLKAGAYDVWGYAVFEPSADGSRGLTIRMNGADVTADSKANVGTLISTYLNAHLVTTVAVNDYFELAAFQNSSSTQSMQAAWLTVTKIRGV